jgi:cytochrome P450
MYFEELFDLKKKQIELGESEKGTMDLMGNFRPLPPFPKLMEAGPMIKANYESSPGDFKTGTSPGATLTKREILGNAFIFLFAGHETTANSIHYSIVLLAIHLAKQRHLQSDIDSIVGSKPTSQWSYYDDMPRLFNSMPGAVIHEELRLIPAVLNVHKGTHGDQVVTMDGRQITIPDGTFIHFNIVGTHRNPRYWPEKPNEFMPERWLPSSTPSTTVEKKDQVLEKEVNGADGLETASFETSGSASLIKPVKGSYIPFSEGARACPGRRFAQVEGIAVISALFHKYSVELDVSEWASDEEVEKMGKEERRKVYGMAVERAEMVIRRSEQVITVQMRAGDRVPLRFVERGRERFGHL